MRTVSWTKGLARIRELADIEGTSGVAYMSDAKLLDYANASRGVWHGMITQADPDRYSTYDDLTADGSASYTLPVDYYASLFCEEVDGDNRRELTRMMPGERNRWGQGAGDAQAYRVVGDTLELRPKPASGTYRHHYVRWADKFLVADTTFTSTHATEVINSTAHGLSSGDGPIRLRTTVNDLPAGFSIETDYWVIVLTSSTFKLATSYDNAIAGTAVSISDDGTGTHTYYSCVDGVNGWEEWMWLDVAVKVLLKQRSDISQLVGIRDGIAREILAAAADRNKGNPARVVSGDGNPLTSGPYPRQFDPDFWSNRS
jgi:hypothetical protein